MRPSNIKELAKICFLGLDRLRDSGRLYASYSVYRERLVNELKVIGDLGYENIFLITAQAIRYALRKGVVVGPARGSASGSLVCLLCGITRGIDPIRFDLRFERFLNASRVTSADIDVDFSDREIPIEFLVKTYGQNRVIQVGTKGLFKMRSALGEFARIFDIPFDQAKKITSCFDDSGAIVKEADAEKWRQAYPELFETAEFFAASKRFRSTTKHPSAVIVVDRPVGQLIPLQNVQDSKTGQRVLTTEWDGDELEKLGYTKFDFLRVSVLNVIADTVEMVNATAPGSLPSATDIFEWVPLDDEKTIALADNADLVGVFQLWKHEPVGIFKAITVRGFEDFYLVTTCIRPGIDKVQFIKRHEDPNSITYETPELEPILSKTYGMILFQEQTMDICHMLAGFSPVEADNIRKIIAKTSNLGDALSLDPYRDAFIKGCEQNGIDPNAASKIWANILAMSRYQFNRSHAVSYSLISWVTAYLKAHYPLQFLCACLNDKNETRFIDELKKLGYAIHPPDVNESGELHTVVGDGVRIGLSHIKGIGRACEKIVAGRPYQNYQDFEQRCRIPSDMLTSLMRIGAFDSLPKYDIMGGLVNDDINRIARTSAEKDLLGYYITGSPLDDYSSQLKGCIRSADVKATRVMVGGIITSLRLHMAQKGMMAFLTIQTLGSEVEAVVWPSDFVKYKGSIKDGAVIVAKGRKTDRGGFALDQIKLLSA